jgi:hypothetical protein
MTPLIYAEGKEVLTWPPILSDQNTHSYATYGYIVSNVRLNKGSRCLGITRNLRRCQRQGMLLCADHRFQPITWFFGAIGILAAVIGLTVDLPTVLGRFSGNNSASSGVHATAEIPYVYPTDTGVFFTVTFRNPTSAPLTISAIRIGAMTSPRDPVVEFWQECERSEPDGRRPSRAYPFAPMDSPFTLGPASVTEYSYACNRFFEKPPFANGSDSTMIKVDFTTPNSTTLSARTSLFKLVPRDVVSQPVYEMPGSLTIDLKPEPNVH